MRLSLTVGILMLVGKSAAWWYTGSAAIFADASESVIHVLAVGFAAFSYRLAARPPDARFLFGYERIAFFSAGFEGALIILAAAGIIATAVRRWMLGIELANLGAGTAIIIAASLINLALGWHLVREGRRTHSIILEANGHHVLTDSWTSFGVIVGLVLVLITGWLPFDPLFAILTALNILWSGGSLVWRSVSGLLDYADPATGDELRRLLERECAARAVRYHEVRFRHTGQRVLVNVHLLFPYETPLGRAHELATEIERAVEAGSSVPVQVDTHLEALEDHDPVHRREPPAGGATN